MKILFWFFITKALFCFSEGKPCPEAYRPHKTRCDAYYKCVLLPTKSHVWLPAKCERGLVFEPNLKMCVMPGDDWECELGENISLENHLDDNNIYGVDSFKIRPDAPTKSPTQSFDPRISEFIELNNNSNDMNNNDNDNDDNDENLKISSVSESEKQETITDQIESSGDGPNEISVNDNESLKQRENFDEMDLPEPEISSKVDPKLTSQLQRLSQLIEGLQNTYKKQGTTNLNDLRPDQLNAFLAHFNIKNEFDSFVPNNNDDDTDIVVPNKSDQLNTKANTIISQYKIKNYKNNTDNKIISTKKKSETKVINLSPETKVILKNSGYRRNEFTNNGEKNGYSNSQIVVNRPEGSVVFTLGNSHKQPQEQKFNNVMKHDPYDYNTEPKISEETLKTVLELSKQMISNQNIRQVLPPNVGGIYQPFIAPIYYSPLPQNSYNPHYNTNNQQLNYPSMNNNYQSNLQSGSQESIDEGYDKFSSSAYISNTKNNNKNKSPSTTVIQNSVIPVHIMTNADKGIIERPETSTISNNDYDNDSYTNMLNKLSALSNKNQIYGFTSSTTAIPISTTTTATESPYNKYHQTSTSSNHLSSTLLSFYTPNPHLDDSNANSIFESTDEDRYPVLSSQYQQLPTHTNFQYQYTKDQTSNNHKTNQFGSQIKQNPNFLINNGDSIIYQSNIKIPTSSSQSGINQQILQQQQQQQKQYLLNMGVRNDYTGITNQKPNNELEQINEYENDPSTLSLLSTSPNYQYQSNILSNSLNKQKNPQYVTNQLSHQNLDQQYSYLNGNNNFQSAISSSPTATQLTNNLFNSNNNVYNGIKSDGGNTLVNLGGNFISYDVYKNKLLPALGVASGINNNIGSNNQLYQPNVEIVTCTPGIRQPNTTDCTKYFVCSRKDSKVLSYSCPPFTAFNSQTRICDAKTYSVCNPEILINQLSLNDNHKLQIDALKALQDANRIRNEAIQAQTLTNLIRYQTEQNVNQNIKKPISNQNSFLNPTVLTNILNSYNSDMPTGNDMDSNNNNNNNNIMMTSTMSSSSSTTITPILNKNKRRKYYCREGDKIPDQTTNSNYFICYKTKDGAMHGHKMQCSASLIFCAKTKLCTTTKNCY